MEWEKRETPEILKLSNDVVQNVFITRRNESMASSTSTRVVAFIDRFWLHSDVAPWEKKNSGRDHEFEIDHTYGFGDTFQVRD